MNPETRRLWRTLVNDLGHILGHHQALLFLGAVLARPLYPMLRREYGMVPGVYIHGARACGKSYLGEVAACLFSPDERTRRVLCGSFHWKLFRSCLLAEPAGHPPLVEEWQDGDAAHNKITDLCMSMGLDPSTTSPAGRITFDTPLAIIGEYPSTHRPLAARCLHFIPHRGIRPDRLRPVANQGEIHLIHADLVSRLAAWEGLAKAFIDAADNKVAPHVGGNMGVMLRIAWGVAVTAHQLLDGQDAPGKELRQWLNKNATLLCPACTLA